MNDESGARMNERLASTERVKDKIARIKKEMLKVTTTNAPVASEPISKTKGFKTLTKTTVNEILTNYMRASGMISLKEHVTNFNKAPNALDIKVEKI